MDIVFDIGNVIFEWDPQKLARTLFSCEKESREAVEKIIEHEDWQLLDKGTLSLEDAISRANNRCSMGVEKIRELYQKVPISLVPIQETVNAIKELSQKGYRLLVLSNMHKHAFEHLFAAYDIWTHFSGIVISSFVKSIKPEPEIFRYLIGTYRLIPGNTIFLDDMEVNVEAARKLGLNTIRVQSPLQSKEELYKMIGIR